MSRRRRFGDLTSSGVSASDTDLPSTSNATSRFQLLPVKDQKTFLGLITKRMAQDSVHPLIVRAAKRITSDCPARDDECELEAIFNAVKTGDSRVEGLDKGVRYVADNFYIDYFTGPKTLLEECAQGACAEDCESQAALCVALAMAVGFRGGLRAWGPAGAKVYNHVFGYVLIPKEAEDDSVHEYGLDPSADVGDGGPGWQPEPGFALTAEVTDGDFTPDDGWFAPPECERCGYPAGEEMDDL